MGWIHLMEVLTFEEFDDKFQVNGQQSTLIYKDKGHIAVVQVVWIYRYNQMGIRIT